jgi:fatty-acid desaturase
LLKGLYNFEQITIIYLVATGILASLCASSVENWQEIVLFHLFIIFLILGLGKIPAKKLKFVKLIRGWYLLAIYPFLFKELTFLIKSLFPFYLEPALIASERLLIDFYTSYFSVLQQTPVLTEIMAFSYWSYYLIIFGVGIYIYRSFDATAFEFYMFKIYATFLICYSLFILIPVRGPHHTMPNTAPTSLQGGFFQSIILFMQSKGSTVGAAFPSSHVAVAWISAFSLRQFKKRLYYLLIPLLLLLTVSVFYLRYHYVFDAIFGYFLAIWLERGYIMLSNKGLHFIGSTPRDTSSASLECEKNHIE